MNITSVVLQQWSKADSTVVDILRDTPNQPAKGTADARYLWPTVVFENVCQCKGNYGGYNCMECDFGWSGTNCQTRKGRVVRKHFASLTDEEKNDFVSATIQLKNEIGVWSVIVAEPENYSVGRVTLQNVSTYDFFIYLHSFVARDDAGACTAINLNQTIDFAHEGPVFPVWHRHYMLTVEKEFQRIMNNDSFGFPYWQWEENDLSPFTEEYYGTPSNGYNPPPVNVSGEFINPTRWNTICDLSYWYPDLTSCTPYWRPCNPADDLAAARPLQRGHQFPLPPGYLPNRVEVMIAIAAPSYDAADSDGNYLIDDPRTSFRSRLEGWNRICSAGNCVGQHYESHMHNTVHLWVGGQMACVPAAINDPIFNLHHCNVDRILESWMKRFYGNEPLNSKLLPAYVPVTGGHPGHNREDFIVPFFPLITAGRQYAAAEEWGYRYDNLVPAEIDDSTIQDCSEILPNCPICDANTTCIDCTDQVCPGPIAGPSQEGLSTTDNSVGLGVGLGLGLGIPLLLSLVAVVILAAVLFKNWKKEKSSASHEMTVVKT